MFFMITLIAVDQLFRLVPYASSIKILNGKKPFIEQYFEYDGPEVQLSQGFYYQDENTKESGFDPYKTPRTNPFTFKFQVEYRNEPCQIPYIGFFPIWYPIIPGITLMHMLHFNQEHSEKPSRLCAVILIIITIVTTAAEEGIRVFLFQIGIGVISFPCLSVYSLICFKLRGEFKEFVKGFEQFVERPSRSIVSSGSHLTRSSSVEETACSEPERMSTPIVSSNNNGQDNIEVAPTQPNSAHHVKQRSKKRKRRRIRRRRSDPNIASYSMYRIPDRNEQNSSTSTKYHIEERTYLTYY
ncbi:uncharacterized protein LOC142346317 [Convolutriloba macropyga]|uniref:uncharacterized protein LOC142346317 n=1 Tax=Convolutriloba macropyga TaxID=536237 RepID=UPI003F5277CA